MSALEQMTEEVDTQGQNTQGQLGSLESGAQALAQALAGYPELAGAAQVIAAMGGDEQGGQQDGQNVTPYNGTVEYEGKKIPVKNGIAQFDGEEFNVFRVPGADVDIVIGEGKRFIGIVQNGKFVLATPEISRQLKQQGVLGEQSKGMAPQAQE